MKSFKKHVQKALSDHLHLDVVRAGYASALIEPQQLKRFLTYFKVDCVFDVGAHVGLYAKQLRRIGFTGHIISFEPNPDCWDALEKASRSDDKWTVEHVALDEVSRTTTFNIMAGNQFSSLHTPDTTGAPILAEMNSVSKEIEITTQTLNDIFPRLQKSIGFSRPFLKMDTQGHDVSVVRGASEYISQFVGLQSELALTPLYEDASSFDVAIAAYRTLGFKLSALVPNNEGHFPDLHEIDCIMYNSAMDPSKH